MMTGYLLVKAMNKMKPLILILISIIITACAGDPTSSLARQCDKGLNIAFKELDLASARGVGGTWEYTKASGLLTAAKIQYEFGKYPNCIDKVKRARVFIKQSIRK